MKILPSRAASCAITLGAMLALAPRARAQNDALERAMRDELTRSIRELQIGQLARPYFIAYRAYELQGLSASAMNGSLISSGENHSRGMTPEIRVGDYQFDNTNFHDFSSGALIALGSGEDMGFFGGGLPLDDNYLELRRQMWLETDEMYKMAAQSFASKRAALLNRAGRDSLPDFSYAAPVQIVDTMPTIAFSLAEAESLVRELSAIPELSRLNHSGVRLSVANARTLMLNTEGTRTEMRRGLISVSASANGQAADGMPLAVSMHVYARAPAELPKREQLAREIRAMAVRLDSLEAAPLLDRYNGPVLFAGRAAAELFAESFAPALVGRRPPAAGQPDFAAMMEATGRGGVASFTDKIGSRVLPTFMSVVDDPTIAEQDGVALYGTYRVDDDGVPARRKLLVDSGIVEQVLTTRVPVRDSLVSTGNRRGDGAAPSNLIVTAANGVSDAELEARLLALVKQRRLPYGVIVRELGTSAVSRDDPMELMAAMRSRGTGRNILLAYRVYSDGHEELVRGARLTDFSTRSFRDIVAATSARTVYHRVSLAGSFPIPPEMLDQMADAAPAGALASYVVPSMLFEDVTLERMSGEQPKPPLSPPPGVGSR